MPLREDQIVRYSRQILLREIGGSGQERLLSTGVIAGSGGAATGTTTAYLAASGVAVVPAPVPADPSEVGFLISVAEAGSSAARAIRAALLEANSDATATREPSVWLAEAPAHIPDSPTARVLMGGTDGGATIVFGRSAADGEFLRRNAPSHPVPTELADEVGALAALVVQRWVLGIESGAGCIDVDATGNARLRTAG